MNKERVRRLIEQGKMTRPGLAVFPNDEAFKIPVDILKELKRDLQTWKIFKNFQKATKEFAWAGWMGPEAAQKNLKSA